MVAGIVWNSVVLQLAEQFDARRRGVAESQRKGDQMKQRLGASRLIGLTRARALPVYACAVALIVTIGLFMATRAVAEPSQYLCVVEEAAGLHYDPQNSAWRPEAFGMRKYTLRRLTNDDRDHQRGKWWVLLDEAPEANWAFFEPGNDTPMPLSICVDNPKSVSAERFSCKSVLFDAVFDKSSRRFETIYHASYISQGFFSRREHPEQYKYRLSRGQVDLASHPDDLFIEIGKCSPS
jgi:hypothetical protein